MRVVTAVFMAAMLMTSFFVPVDVSAEKVQEASEKTTKKQKQDKASNAAIVRPFDLYESDLLDAYNKAYQMNSSNIKDITNNGGNYSGSPLKQAIDGDLNTHWETGKPNNDSFLNEVEFTFKNEETLNRIVYAARQSGAKGKGFAKEFDIYGSTKEKGDNYELVSSGSYAGSAGDVIEIKFKPTKFKRVKFVFKKADQDWASAAEFQFYKEDPVSEKMRKLFTDDTYSEVNKEFTSDKALKELEEDAKDHPLYKLFQEEIDDAKAILNDKGVKPVTAETVSFTHYSNDKYSKAFRMDNDNIKSIRNNAGHYGSAVIGNAIDQDLETYWETNTGNSKDFTNEVEIEFKEAVKLNRLIYGARNSDNKGFAEEYEIHISKTSKGDTFQKLATGKHKTVDGLVESTFKPTTFKRVKFKFKKSNQNWATLSEIAFYKKDDIADDVHNLFTNGLMNELKPEFASKKKIEALEKEINGHPIEKELQENIDIAKKILDEKDYGKEAIVTASQRGDAWATASMHQIPRTSFSLDTFGRYITPGETVQVFVDADPNGIMPELVFGQIADDKGGWIRRYPLKPGINTITAPSSEKMNPAIIYVENSALPNEQAYAPKVRLTGGTDFPVYYHGKTDPAQFKKELEQYVAKISTDDADFANGKPKDVVYNVAELISENNNISTSAAGALQGLQEIEGTKKDVSDTMDEWEIMWEEFQKISGNVKDDPNPKHRYFPAKFNSRVFTKGPYGWSAGGYTGYNGGDTPRRDSGFFKQIVKPISTPGNDDWAYFHEWGHNINNQPTEHVEVTNNIYAVIMREKLLNNYDDRADWNALYKRFQGEEVSHDYFTYLGILLQLQYYYGEDSYGKASRAARENPKGVLDDLDGTLQKMVIAYSIGLETDLTTFFDEWGYVKATDKMKKKVAHLPKPDVKLEYMHSSGRNYEGNGFTKNAKLNINAVKTNQEKKQTTLSYGIDQSNSDAVMGYEISRDDKVIGYTTSTTFVDKDIDLDKDYEYEVVAYDKLLNPLEPLQAQSKQPTLSVEEFVTLKLRQDYEPMDDVKAISYSGDDVTKKVKIKSNNVDVTKKGTYKVVYEVKDEGTTVTRTTNVTVTSDYTYLSDMKEESSNIAWGGLQKDKAPSGNAITLIRQGLDATYAKGLGVHANSEVVYDVTDEQVDYFESYIGIDQTVKGQNSSATFEVWVDDKKEYSSRVFNAETEHEFIRIPVDGAKRIKLKTTDAGINGNTADHTVWASAKFTKDSSEPTLTIPEDVATKVGTPIDLDEPYKAIDPEDGDLTDKVKVSGKDKVNFDKVGKYTVTYSVTDSDGNKTTKKRIISVVDMEDFAYLSNYDWQYTEESYAKPIKDTSVSDNNLRLTDKDGDEVTYMKGFGTHANSTIVYDVTKLNAAYLTSYVGIDRQMYNTIGSVVFQVYVDDEKKFDSGLMNSTDPQKYFEVDISGAKELKLVVTDGGNGIGSDHATWGDTKIYFAGENQISTIVDPVDTNSKVVTGITQPNTTVTVKDKEDKELGEAQVDKHGDFEVEIPKQDLDTKLTITVRNDDGDMLDEVTVKVIKGKVDTTELEALIKESKDYKEADYTVSTFKNLEESITEAEKLVKEAREQEEVEKAIQQLQEAIDGLEKAKEPKPEIDTSELEDLIAEAKGYKEDAYTEESYQQLQGAISAAGEVVQDAVEQEEIKDAINLLQQAIDGLEKAESGPEPNPEPEIDTKQLEQLIEHAKVYDEADYTESTFNQLQEKISKAESVVSNATKQDEIEEAITALQEAIEELERVPDPEPEPEIDTSNLAKLIEQAKLYDEADYTEATFNQLQQAINHAEQVVQNATTEQDVEEATIQLTNAINGLERIPNPDPEEDLTTTELSKLIAHAKTYDKADFTDSSYAELQQAINESESVVNNATTQEEVNASVKQLEQAIQGLVVIPQPEPEPEIEKDELARLLAHAKTYDEADYTESSYTSLQQAINDAESVVNNATTQEEVNGSVQQLKQAIQGLEEIPRPDPEPEIETDELEKLIAHAKTYDEADYTDSSYEALQEAIHDAESVADNPSNQEEVEASFQQLQASIADLEEITEPDPEPAPNPKPNPEPEPAPEPETKPEPEVETDELVKLIAHAKTYDEADYTRSSYEALQEAISESDSVVANATTQEEVEASLQQLQVAIDGLEEVTESEPQPEIETKPEIGTGTNQEMEQEPNADIKKDTVGKTDPDVNTLPSTSTDVYNMLLLGFILISMGVITLISRRKLSRD